MIQKLKETFSGLGEVKGYEFKQIAFSATAYLYVKTNLDSNVTNYEVFLKKTVHKFDFETKEQLDEIKEIYPKSNNFGVWAWNFTNYDNALNKFNTL